MQSKPLLMSFIFGASLAFSGYAFAASVQVKSEKNDKVPAEVFDLSHWKLDVPLDEDKNDKADTITVKELKKYSHPDFFHLDDQDRLVFTSPNKATTTPNTSNARSELRYMLRGKNTKIKTHSAANNFAVQARKGSDKFGSVGGKMEATLQVNHVAKNAGNPDKRSAYSLVVGQIHAIKYKSTKSGFGFGNEPLKIFYKKWPDHETGSLFWTYERNLAKDNPLRKDIDYPIWGNAWDNKEDPKENGIALGEDFSYTVNVYKNTMHLIFETANKDTKHFKINLANNRDAFGQVDEDDNLYSYGGDHLYFKAGVYNQCSPGTGDGFWYAGCDGTGIWETDKANGDYAQATFSRLVVGDSTPM